MKKYNRFYFKPQCVILRDFALQLLFRAFLKAHSYSVDIAEKNKGSLDIVRARFGDRNVVTFLPLLRKWKLEVLQIWSIYPSKDWKLNAEIDSDNKKSIRTHLKSENLITNTRERGAIFSQNQISSVNFYNCPKVPKWHLPYSVLTYPIYHFQQKKVLRIPAANFKHLILRREVKFHYLCIMYDDQFQAI